MNIVDHQILPLRDARQQFELAGVESSVHSFNSLTGLYYIGGKGGPCAMRVEEWMRYLAMCDQWAIAPQDLHDAPSISMLVVSSEEEAELAALRLRPNSDFARSFREIEDCLNIYDRCLSDDERDEIIRQIGVKLRPLKAAVLRAEEIWREDAAITEDERLALNQWHLGAAHQCATDVLKGAVAVNGKMWASGMWYDLCVAFLKGAQAQLTRPFARKQLGTKGGPEAA